MKDIKSQIKSYIYSANLDIKAVLEVLNSQYGYNETPSNFSNKLKRGNIKYQEVLDIAEIIGYEIQWIPKPPE